MQQARWIDTASFVGNFLTFGWTPVGLERNGLLVELVEKFRLRDPGKSLKEFTREAEAFYTGSHRIFRRGDPRTWIVAIQEIELSQHSDERSFRLLLALLERSCDTSDVRWFFLSGDVLLLATKKEN